jgi:hypothetical protein
MTKISQSPPFFSCYFFTLTVGIISKMYLKLKTTVSTMIWYGQDLAAGVDQGPEVAGQGVDLEVGAGVVVGVKVQGVEVVVQAEANLGVLVKTAKNILNHDQNHQRRMVINSLTCDLWTLIYSCCEILTCSEIQQFLLKWNKNRSIL